MQDTHLSGMAEKAEKFTNAVSSGGIADVLNILEIDPATFHERTSRSEFTRAKNMMLMRGIGYCLPILSNRGFQQEYPDIHAKTQNATQSLLANITFTPSYVSLQNTIQRFFEEDLLKTDVLQRISLWSQLDLDARKQLAIDIINQVLKAADATSEDFADMRAVKGNSDPAENEVQVWFFEKLSAPSTDDVERDADGLAIGDYAIEIANRRLREESPAPLVKAAIHEVLHTLDARLKNRQSPEYKENSIIFEILSICKAQYCSSFYDYIYDHSPVEKFDGEEKFYGIITNAMENSKKPDWSWLPPAGYF